MLLEGKAVIVTGASTGIGKASAYALAKEGAWVGLVARRENLLSQIADEIRANGGRASVLPADVSNAQDVRQVTEAFVQETNRLDGVFANAGINGLQAPLEEIEPEEWDFTINTNLRSTFLTVKYAVPHMKLNGGSIVIDSSVNGTRMFSNHGFSAYATSKAGQAAFAKMAAAELGRHKIRVNVICPGAIFTEIRTNTWGRNMDRIRRRVRFSDGAIPLTAGVAGQAEQVAELVLFLISEKSSHISGSEIWVDGAESLMEG